MGLDMYAYTIRKELVDDNEVTDTNVHSKARRAVGFITYSEEEYDKLTDEGRTQYRAKKREAKDKAVEEGWFDPDFAYWRKFNILHGWMAQLYRSKGGTDPDFNCNTVRIELDDLDRLESCAKLGAMMPVPGFFFGSDEPFNEDDKQEVLGFVQRARDAIANGMAVYYDSWW